MEGMVCKTSAAKIVPDEPLTLNSCPEGILNSGNQALSVTHSPVNNRNIEINENSNGQVDDVAEISGACISPRSLESCHKSSPTLIEHAFNAVKNLFSPDRSKGKVMSVESPIAQQHIAPESPSTSACVSNTSEAGVESLNAAPTVSGENGSKDHMNMNQPRVFHSSLDVDSHNNTDDSFLTTVSLIDESFQSAVTHFDENGEALRNGARLSDNILNNSRSLDLMDPLNDTLDVSDYCLENTTLKNGSFASEGIQLCDSSNEIPNEDVESMHAVDVDSNKPTFERAGHVPQPEYQNEFLKEYSHNLNELQLNEASDPILGNSTILNGNLREVDCRYSEAIENPEPLPNKSLEKLTSPFYSSEMVSLSENKIFEESPMVATPQDVTTNVTEEAVELPIVEKDNPVECSISTTTVILNTASDPSGVCYSVKSDDSSTNTSSFNSFETYETPDNATESQLIKEREPFRNIDLFEMNSNANSRFEEKKFSKSEGSSPDKATDPTRLNKSVDYINHRGTNDSTKGKRTPHDSSWVDISLIKNIETPGNLAGPRKFSNETNVGEVKTIYDSYISSDKGNKENEQIGGSSELEVGKSEGASEQDEPFGTSVLPQGSYTILTINNNLNRPVINSSSFICGPREESSPFLNNSAVSCEKEADVEKSEIVISPQNESIIKSAKQSTPLYGGGARVKQGETPQESAKALPLGLRSSLTPDQVSEDAASIISRPDLLGNAMKIFSLDSGETSSLMSVKGSGMLFSNSTTPEISRVSSQSFPCLNNTWDELAPKELNKSFHGNTNLLKSKKSPGKLNKTFEKSCTSLAKDKLNQTYETNPEVGGSRTSETAGSPKLNQTYDKSTKPAGSGHRLNQTYEKLTPSPRGIKLNQTFDKKSISPESGQLNQTYEKKVDANAPEIKTPEENPTQVLNTRNKANVLNETFDKGGESPDAGKLNLTYDKKPESPAPGSMNQTFSVDSNVTNTRGEEQGEMNRTFEKKRGVAEKHNAGFGEVGDANKTATIARSPQFTPNGESTGDRNIESLEFGSHKDLLNVSFMSTASSTNSKDQTVFVDDKLSTSPELAQLIKEQFSSKDIEKICSVVDDMSSMKLTSDILRASEQFDKSFHESLANNEFKAPQTESKSEKAVNPLSPQSFEFLNSIRGKPTGRDLSRESLYVKFDPLVQPSANSLIDFTNDVEALVPQEASPEGERNDSVCENLLAISPLKKPDDIVPPLTPLSHKNKSVSEDKAERLKELQNEIYFLKNLYAERERANKAKMDDFESQITQLTGHNCILEDRLKESNDREKSLVKKLKEQTQSIGQLKVIMEEYIKVISKLTSELESLRAEKAKQVEALTAEKDSYMTHLQNTEAAFTDVHTKYEKSKKTIVSLRANESQFKNTIAEQSSKIEEYKEKAREAQEKAFREYQKVQEELNEVKTSHAHETARLRAQLKKTELKMEAIQESLDQKIKENQKLTAICDDLIEGKK